MEDLPLLVNHFMREVCREENRPVLDIPQEAITLLSGYAFPGNVRELRFLIHDAVRASHEGTLDMARIRETVSNRADLTPPPQGTRTVFGPELPSLKEVCDDLVQEAMRRTDGNQSLAAQLIGVSRQALNKRLNNMRRKD
ncbi:helix-turn-helix domain-containing protein [Salidesulfovibrio brasiliensis]|uniref:helix-turn-helix domain-containing protein n=1 Tax=Salidesulfovibrio brasiliensis TaxID=221711 RepID=UPI0034E19D9E